MNEGNLTGAILPRSSGVIVKEDNTDYFSVITNVGNELIAAALASKTPLKLTQMAVGDGGGGYVYPDRKITQLRREVWRGTCSVTQDPSNPNMILVRTNIPVDVGGWEVREIGVFDEDNHLIVFASAPGWRKLAIINGTSNPMELSTLITVADTSAIDLNISYDGVSATLKDLENHNGGSNSHNGHFADPNIHLDADRLNRLKVGTNYELACEKIGNTYTLSGFPQDLSARVIGIFQVPDVYESGDIWTVDGVAYEVRTSNGKPLKPSSFTAGAVLTAVFDTQQKVMHFSALGSGGGGTVVSETPPDDNDVNWFNPKNRLLSVNVSGNWIAIAGVYGDTIE